VDRGLDVSLPTANAQTRISLASLQADIVALQTRVDSLEDAVATGPIDASRLTGTIAAARIANDCIEATHLKQEKASLYKVSGGWMAVTLNDDVVIGGRLGINNTTPAKQLDMVGNFSTSGGVQVGTTGADANTYPGMLRWNGGNLEYSNGTQWKVIQTAP
jgi:hypothetical protein